MIFLVLVLMQRILKANFWVDLVIGFFFCVPVFLKVVQTPKFCSRIKNDFWSGLVDVFERILPKTSAPNHSMLGSYPIYIDPAPYLEYTRAYSRAYWHVKKGSE